MTYAHFYWDGRFLGSGLGFTELVWGLVGGLLSIAFWVVLIVVVVRLLGRGRSGRSGAALSVLEERYARGEITRDEFLERKAVLEGRVPPSP